MFQTLLIEQVLHIHKLLMFFSHLHDRHYFSVLFKVNFNSEQAGHIVDTAQDWFP